MYYIHLFNFAFVRKYKYKKVWLWIWTEERNGDKKEKFSVLMGLRHCKVCGMHGT